MVFSFRRAPQEFYVVVFKQLKIKDQRKRRISCFSPSMFCIFKLYFVWFFQWFLTPFFLCKKALSHR